MIDFALLLTCIDLIINDKSHTLLFKLNVFFIFLFSEQRRLNEWISHFEGLSYDHNHVQSQHHRARRSLEKDAKVRFNFKAHGR